MSRCELCVLSVYIASLQAYRHDVAALRRSLAELGVSPREWPAEIQLDIKTGDCIIEKDVLAAAAAVGPEMDHSKEMKWWTKEVLFEAMMLIVWVLRGCRG